MSWRRIALFAGVVATAYVLFLALTLPASLLFGWVLAPDSPLGIASPQGTPWHGHAGELIYDGSSLGRVSWDVHPWALFSGRLDYDLAIDSAMTHLQGEAVLTSSGKITATDIRGPLALSTALEWLTLPLPAGAASGRLRLDLDRVVLENNRPTVIKGRVALDDLHALWPRPMPLGAYVAGFKTNDNTIQGHAHDTGGPLDLDATIHIKPNGRYQLHGTITPRGNAKSGLKQALGYLGRTDSSGTTHFSFSGDLSH
jgi:general secretion pathway protein N